jgi:hypothetical protein
MSHPEGLKGFVAAASKSCGHMEHETVQRGQNRSTATTSTDMRCLRELFPAGMLPAF